MLSVPPVLGTLSGWVAELQLLPGLSSGSSEAGQEHCGLEHPVVVRYQGIIWQSSVL